MSFLGHEIESLFENLWVLGCLIDMPMDLSQRKACRLVKSYMGPTPPSSLKALS